MAEQFSLTLLANRFRMAPMKTPPFYLLYLLWAIAGAWQAAVKRRYDRLVTAARRPKNAEAENRIEAKFEVNFSSIFAEDFREPP